MTQRCGQARHGCASCRDRAEFADQLSKSGVNSDLIKYLSKEVFTIVILRERLLKGIADELPMKHDFETRCDFLRDEVDNMDGKGKPGLPFSFMSSGGRDCPSLPFYQFYRAGNRNMSQSRTS